MGARPPALPAALSSGLKLCEGWEGDGGALGQAQTSGFAAILPPLANPAAPTLTLPRQRHRPDQRTPSSPGKSEKILPY